MSRHVILLQIETYPKLANRLLQQDCRLDHATQWTKSLRFTYCAFGKTILQLVDARWVEKVLLVFFMLLLMLR